MRRSEMPSRIRSPIRRVSVLAVLVGALIAGCGGDFDYKISGDRPANETRGAVATGGGKSTTHEDLMKLQEQYQAKIAKEQGGTGT